MDMMSPSYVSLLERAGRHRDRYEQESLERAREADRSGYNNPNMFSNEMRTMTQNNLSRGMAQPQWDAWFQAVQESNPEGDMPVFGGARRQRPSINALTRIR